MRTLEVFSVPISLPGHSHHETLIDYTDALNVDEDFEYFQFYGQKRQETESGWKEQQNEDIKKFKISFLYILFWFGGISTEILWLTHESKANLIYDESDKPPVVYVIKEKAPEAATLKVFLFFSSFSEIPFLLLCFTR